jgi:catechol 2,3-dioxygenase
MVAHAEQLACRIGHVHLKVRDASASARFYGRVLGLKVTESVGDDFVFMSAGEAHHDVALQSVGAAAAGPSHRGVGLYHSAFEAATASQLLAVLERLGEVGVLAALVDHGISWAAYFSDPDGNGVEVYMDRRSVQTGREGWSGKSAALRMEQIRAAAGREQ